MLRNMKNRAKALDLASHSQDLNPIKGLWDVLDKQAQFIEESSNNLQNLLKSDPMHICRGLAESIPQVVQRGSTQ